MFKIIATKIFSMWLEGLKDLRARTKIVARIQRLEAGNFGDVKSVGDGVLELRINTGPGYRVYLAKRGPEVILLLCGGDKSTQREDIKMAKQLASRIEVETNEN